MHLCCCRANAGAAHLRRRLAEPRRDGESGKAAAAVRRHLASGQQAQAAGPAGRAQPQQAQRLERLALPAVPPRLIIAERQTPAASGRAALKQLLITRGLSAHPAKSTAYACLAAALAGQAQARKRSKYAQRCDGCGRTQASNNAATRWPGSARWAPGRRDGRPRRGVRRGCSCGDAQQERPGCRGPGPRGKRQRSARRPRCRSPAAQKRPGQGCSQCAHWPGSTRVSHRRSTGVAQYSRREAYKDTNLLALSSVQARSEQAAGRTAGSASGSAACFFSSGCACRAAASKLSRSPASVKRPSARIVHAMLLHASTSAAGSMGSRPPAALARRTGSARPAPARHALGKRAPLVSVCALLLACQATGGAPGRLRAAAVLRRRSRAHHRRSAGPRRRCAEPGRRPAGRQRRRPPRSMRQAAGSRPCRPRPWRGRRAQRL